MQQKYFYLKYLHSWLQGLKLFESGLNFIRNPSDFENEQQKGYRAGRCSI